MPGSRFRRNNMNTLSARIYAHHEIEHGDTAALYLETSIVESKYAGSVEGNTSRPTRQIFQTAPAQHATLDYFTVLLRYYSVWCRVQCVQCVWWCSGTQRAYLTSLTTRHQLYSGNLSSSTAGNLRRPTEIHDIRDYFTFH